MIIKTIPVTEFQQNCRLVIDPKTKIAAVVDPGGDVARIVDEISREAVEIEWILLTHGHLDHIGAAVELKAALEVRPEPGPGKVQIAAHADDFALCKTIEQQAAMFGMAGGSFASVPQIDFELVDGGDLAIGELSARIIHTPGHSPGHIVLFFDTDTERVLISGDTLFAGSIGRTDLPGGSHQALISSIKEKLFSLPDDTRVLPGHGPETTIGREKTTNPYLR